MSMVRPSLASLNSLAEVLRRAQPLYSECHSILNYTDDEIRMTTRRAPQGSESSPEGHPVNKRVGTLKLIAQ
jgi:hypothetical protein